MVEELFGENMTTIELTLTKPQLELLQSLITYAEDMDYIGSEGIEDDEETLELFEELKEIINA